MIYRNPNDLRRDTEPCLLRNANTKGGAKWLLAKAVCYVVLFVIAS